ncbi:MAG: acetolactate decarboxylase, partial [Xanthobacteraceae bacterium]
YWAWLGFEYALRSTVREVGVQTLLEQGHFGLGTFADLGGEMVVVDGRAYFLWARSTNSSQQDLNLLA